ncbi:MAG: hypothetical protein ABI472_20880 [Ginsengibacter sp.]
MKKSTNIFISIAIAAVTILVSYKKEIDRPGSDVNSRDKVTPAVQVAIPVAMTKSPVSIQHPDSTKARP